MKKLDHDAEREKIAAIAAAIMAEVGAGSITVQMVADRLHSTRGKVLHYFKSKREVVEAAFEWANKQAIERSAELLLHTDSANYIESIVESNLPLDESTDVEWKVRVSFWEYALSSEEGRLKHQQTEQDRIVLIQEILREQQQNGVVKADLDRELLAYQIYDMVSGLASALLFIPLEERPQRASALNGFLKAIYAEST